MRLLTVSCLAAAAVLSCSPALANGRGGGSSSHGNPHTVTTTHGAPASGPKQNSARTTPSSATMTPKAHSSPEKVTTTTASAKTHGNPNKTTFPTTATTTSGSTTGSTTTTAPTNTGTTTGSNRERLNPIAQKISSKPQLAARLETMLPKGMTLNSASRGFKNQGQFIAALQASQKHNIPFRDLKAAMLGKNGAAPMSLGQAMHSLRSAPSAPTTTSTGTRTGSGTTTGSRTTTASGTTAGADTTTGSATTTVSGTTATAATTTPRRHK